MIFDDIKLHFIQILRFLAKKCITPHIRYSVNRRMTYDTREHYYQKLTIMHIFYNSIRMINCNFLMKVV